MSDAVIIREVDKIRNTIKNAQGKVQKNVEKFVAEFEQLQPEELLEVAETDAYEQALADLEVLRDVRQEETTTGAEFFKVERAREILAATERD